MSGQSFTIHALRYDTGEPVAVVVTEGRIVSVSGILEDQRLPVLDSWVAPAFFDVQINGALGRSFGSPEASLDDIAEIVAVCRRHGISGLFPTLITDSEEHLTAALRRIVRAVAGVPALQTALPGIHLEGPYISPLDGPRGAHPRQHVRNPDWDEFQRMQEAAEGRIRLLTLAPELDGALPFIEKLTASGVIVALGHTAANASQIQDAVSAGARLSTHLGNGCSAMLHRHANPIWEQAAEDRLWASLISDGQHLPASVLRCLLRCKTPSRTLLTCDASPLAGLPPGRYRLWEQELEIVPEGKIVVAGTPYLAGSWVFTDACVRSAMSLGGATLAEAVDMAAIRPRELLGLPLPALRPGAPADLILFRLDEHGLPHVVETLADGHSYRADSGGRGTAVLR